jgi:hypothetical protein
MGIVEGWWGRMGATYRRVCTWTLAMTNAAGDDEERLERRC